MTSSFRKDLEESAIIEQQCIPVLSKKLRRKLKLAPPGCVEYDLISGGKKPITVEIKYDKMSAKTGNFAFELFRQNVSDNYMVPTGLLSTRATWWAQATNSGKIYLFKTDKLQKTIDKTMRGLGGIQARYVLGGDDSRTMMCLISIEALQNLCEILDF